MGRGRGSGRGRGRGRGGFSHQGKKQGRGPADSKARMHDDGGSDTTVQADSVETNNEVKRFSRRQVTSNWHRYEEPLPSIDDEFSEEAIAAEQKEEVFRLEVFEDLMKRKFVHAGFRFRSEQSIDDEEPSTPSVFVNCQSLNDSLECIALHERLGMDSSLLEPSTVSSFQTIADSRRDSLLHLRYGPISQNTSLSYAMSEKQQNLTQTDRATSSPESSRTQRQISQPGKRGDLTVSAGANEAKSCTKQSSAPPGFMKKTDQDSLLDSLLTEAEGLPNLRNAAAEMSSTDKKAAPPDLSSSNNTLVATNTRERKEADDDLDALLALSSSTPSISLSKQFPTTPSVSVVDKQDTSPNPLKVTGPALTSPSADLHASETSASSSLGSQSQKPQDSERDTELDFLLGLSG